MGPGLRGRAEHPAAQCLVHRDDSRSPYTVLSVTATLIETLIDASIGIAGTFGHPWPARAPASGG